MNDRLYQHQGHEHEYPTPKRQCLDEQNQYSGEASNLCTFTQPEFVSYLNTNFEQNAFEEAWTTTSQNEQDTSAVLPFGTPLLSSEFCQDIYTEYSEASSSTDWQQQGCRPGGLNDSANNVFDLGPSATSSGYGEIFSKETTPNPRSLKRELCFGMVN